MANEKKQPNASGKHSSRRVAQDLAEMLRGEIEAGNVRPGNFLPSVRELMKEHGSASLTVQRALKRLEEEGLVSAEPRQGYRVLGRGGAVAGEAPFAFILSSWCVPGVGEGFSRMLTALLQESAERRGWKMVTVVTGKEDAAEIVRRATSEKSWGLVLDTPDAEVVAQARAAGLSVVVVDSWVRGAGFDAVVQDDFCGGQLAAEYLASRGHKRIGWIGPAKKSQRRLERRGGVETALGEAGLTVRRTCDIDFDSPELHEAAQVMLSGKNRPTGVLALWLQAANALKETARDMGMNLGDDLEIATWTTEETYESYQSRMPGRGLGMPTVVWSLRSMAESALSRLAERRENPELPVSRINIPTRLEVPAGD
jgi:LacI family transcriptional regulator, galactose operon repressor